jgi:hypothetical protein
LKHLSKGLTREDVREFGRILESVSEEDAEFLPELFLLFDDDWSCPGVFCPIIHAIESFPCIFYVKTFLKGLKDFYNNSKECIEEQFVKLFNSNPYLETLKENIDLADKETLLRLLDNCENDKYCPERHKSIFAELRRLMNT